MLKKTIIGKIVQVDIREGFMPVVKLDNGFEYCDSNPLPVGEKIRLELYESTKS